MSVPTTDLRVASATGITRKVSPVVIVAAVVALVFIGLGALVASQFAPPGRDTAVITGFVLGTVAPTIVGLLALIRGDHAAQVGNANAERLVEATSKVEQIAKDVNGHLQRHDNLAQTVADVAETVAQAAGVTVKVARDPETRTRATDPPASAITPESAPGPDSAPVADQR